MNLLIDSLDLVAAVISIFFMTKLAYDTKENSTSMIVANSIKRSLLNQVVVRRA